MFISRKALVVALSALFTLPALAVTADRETANIGSNSDADEMAVWLHPTDLSKSLVIGAVKNDAPASTA